MYKRISVGKTYSINNQKEYSVVRLGVLAESCWSALSNMSLLRYYKNFPRIKKNKEL